MGRVGVDFYPTEHGSLVHVRHFDKFLGGSPTNVAVAAARLGDRSALITRTGPDPFGEYVHAALRGFGVDDRFVSACPGFQTPVTFCETFPPDHFPIYFYRSPKAPDLEISPSELDYDAIDNARLFWVTVERTQRRAEPFRDPRRADESRAARTTRSWTSTSVPSFWRSVHEAREATREALPHATIAIGNLSTKSRSRSTPATRTPAADALLELGPETRGRQTGPRRGPRQDAKRARRDPAVSRGGRQRPGRG